MNTPSFVPNRLHHGAAWYPELWPQEVWREDIALMLEHGLTCVRVGEFAWSRMEPIEGKYDFSWLRAAIDLCHGNGIGVILGTPTATPPQWVLKKFPDLCVEDRNGHRAMHGGRQHASYSHIGYRKLSAQIAGRMAQEFGSHPALTAWQTDNEFRCHVECDTSPVAVVAWHRWLRAKYGDVAALNAAWNTHLWSEYYTCFEDVPPAKNPGTTGHHNYSLETDYRRFLSDEVIAFNRVQCDAIRAHSAAPITHNTLSRQDDRDLAADLDFLSIDCYQPPDRLWDPFIHFDTMRHLGRRGGGFWIMENAPECLYRVPFPKKWIRALAFATWCSGGEGFAYWPWRQQTHGVEISHPSVLHSCGKPTLGAADVRLVGELRPLLEPILREWHPAPAEVALIRCERNGRMMLEGGISTFGSDFSWWDNIHLHHRSLLECGVWKDVRWDAEPFDGYRFVATNSVMAASPVFLENARRFVENGGILVVGAQTGTRTENGSIPTNAIQGDVEKTFGFSAAHQPRLAETPVTLTDGTNATARFCMTCYAPQPEDEVLGTYDDPHFGGLAWGVSRSLGKGRVYVLGSELDAAGTRHLYETLLDRHGITRRPQPWGVFTFPLRHTDGREALAIVNSTEEAQTVNLPQAGRDLLHDERSIPAGWQIAAGECVVISFSA